MKKTIITALMLAVLGVSCAMAFTKDEEKQIQGIIAKYIKDNPDVVLQALQDIQDRREKEQKEEAKKALQKNRKALESGSMVLGNPKGSIVIVEFFDYNCGYCKNMFSMIYKKVSSNKDIKWVLHELPSLSPDSVEAARVAIAAGNQGKYAEFHSAAMQKKGLINKEVALGIAKDLKLDMKKLDTDMESDSTKVELIKNRDLAGALDAQAVPTFIIGDELILGAFGEEELNRYIEAATKKKK